MITKVQGKLITGHPAAISCPRLTALEKGMLRWAVVDPEDRVLDATIGEGVMAEYLRRNMQCEVCGVSDSMEDVRRARNRLQNCDIVYATPGDIPWRDEAFDVVMMKLSGEDDEQLTRRLQEVNRVMRPGSQLVLGAPCYPTPVSVVADFLHDEADEPSRMLNRQSVAALLGACGFENLSWQRTGFGSGVMVAWKTAACQDEDDE